MDSQPKKTFLQKLGIGRAGRKREASRLRTAQQQQPVQEPPTPQDIAVPQSSQSQQQPISPSNESGLLTRPTNPSNAVSLPSRPPIRKGENLGLQALYNPPTGLSAIVDIVLVHGLTGNAYDTWYHKDKVVHWPSELLKEDIPDARILTFGYDADVVNWGKPASVNRIGNHAEALLGALIRHRERSNSEDRKIIFIVHSLGGLVVENALALSKSSPEAHLQKMEANTVGLAFLGTPHFGADKASWGVFSARLLNIVLKTNDAIVAVLDPDSEMLATIQKRFHEILRVRGANNNPIAITCFHEELPFPQLGLIVDMKSATLPGYQCYGIHATHTGMTKFEGYQDEGYLALVGEVIRWVKAAREEKTLFTALHEECLRSLYFDGLDAREENVARALPGTFSWIWKETDCDFLPWLRSGHGIYWISGRAASGKSTMMKYLFETAQFNAAHHFKTQGKPIIVAYFLDRSMKNTQIGSLESIARAILWQLLSQRLSFFDHILPRFKEKKRTRSKITWKTSELKASLADILSHKPSYPIWLFIDALDEYSGELVDIADLCKEFSTNASEKVRICVSSRPEPEITQTFRSDQVLDIQAYTQEDIKKYVTHEFRRIENIVGEDTRAQMMAAISQKANGLFMWVRLVSCDIVMSSLFGIDTPRLLDCLQDLRHKQPRKELTGLYLQILQRKDDIEMRKEAELMLGIVACACRGLSLSEFHFILDLEPARRRESEDSALGRRIDTSTGGLLDYQTGHLVFSHETVSTFIRNLPGSQDDGQTADPILRSHQQILIACILLLEECEPPRPPGPPLIQDIQDSRTPSAINRDNKTGLWSDKKQVAPAESRYSGHGQGYSPPPQLTAYSPFEHSLRGHELTSKSPRLTKIDARRLLELRHYAILNWEHHRKEARARATALNVIWITPPISNQEFLHWRRLYLARCWEQPSALLKHQHPVTSSLEFLILSTIPAEVFFMDIDPKAADAVKYLHPRGLLYKDVAGVDQERPELDTVISVEYGPGYSLHLHTGQMLEISIDNMLCKITHPRKEKSEESWFQLYEERLHEGRGLEDAIGLRDYEESEFRTTTMSINFNIGSSLVQEIRLLIRHYLQIEGNKGIRKSLCGRHGRDRLQQGLGKTRFATPLHYAAFYGLVALIEQLYNGGASMNHVSKEARYGTPLLAAIFGLEALDETAIGISTQATVKKLFRCRANPNLPGNGDNLGTVTPLNAAVKQYTGYEKRVGLGFESMKDVIEILLEEGAEVDPVTRAIARSSHDLRRLFSRYTPRSNQTSQSLSSTSNFSSTPPMDIPISRSSFRRMIYPNATFGALAPMQPPGPSIERRLVQTMEDHFMVDFKT